MRVTARDFPLVLPKSKLPRAVGVHQSDIIRSVALASGLLKPEWAEEVGLVDARTITDPIAITRMCIGLAWEEWYIPNQLPDTVDHPGEMEFEGIYMNPDGESLSVIISDDHTSLYWTIIHEVKATYKSTKTVGDLSTQREQSKNWMWMAQLKSYCIAKNTRYARLHVLFLCGNYKFPIHPITKVFDIEFTQEELDDNWNFMTEYALYKLKGTM